MTRRRRKNRVMLSLMVLLSAFFLTATVAQFPPTLAATPFDYSVSHRQSVCDRQEAFHNGTVLLRNALDGFHLHTLLAVDNNFVVAKEGVVLDKQAGGLIPVLINELAKRAKFSWRNSYALAPTISIDTNQTYSDLLIWSIETFDFMAAFWGKTLDRIDRGASFSEGWYDATLILVGIESGSGTSSLDVFTFLEPFSAGVWILIAVTLLLSGLVYMAMDWYDSDSDNLELEHSPAHTIWLSALSFTGQFEFEPSTNAARLFTFSLAFFCLLVTSAYTANLASFLVVQNTPTVQIESVDDAIKNDLGICVIRGAAPDVELTRAFPTSKHIIRVETELDTYQWVRERRCDYALTSVSAWEEQSRNPDVNGDCLLTWIGRPFRPQEGGFVTKSDSGTLCTSLIRDVVNLHLVEMKNEHFIDFAWDAHLAKLPGTDCNEAEDSDDDENTTQLTLQNMGGTFIVHYSLTAVAVLIAILSRWHKKRKANVVKAHTPESATASQIETEKKLTLPSDDNVNEEEDLATNCKEMLEQHDEKLSQMLLLLQAMQSESNSLREMLQQTEYRPNGKNSLFASETMKPS